MNNYIDIYIDGVKLPTPSDYNVEYSDLDVDSLRMINTGKLKRNRIRSNLQKINLTYLLSDIPDINKMMRMIKPSELQVTLYDHDKENRVTKTMYAGNKSFAYIRLVKGVKGKGFKFSLTEV